MYEFKQIKTYKLQSCNLGKKIHNAFVELIRKAEVITSADVLLPNVELQQEDDVGDQSANDLNKNMGT
jgi:hypothetical protein